MRAFLKNHIKIFPTQAKGVLAKIPLLEEELLLEINTLLNGCFKMGYYCVENTCTVNRGTLNMQCTFEFVFDYITVQLMCVNAVQDQVETCHRDSCSGSGRNLSPGHNVPLLGRVTGDHLYALLQR